MNQNKPVKDYIYVILQLLIFVSYFLHIQMSRIQLPEWLCYSGLVVLGFSILFGMVALIQINTKLSPFPSPVSSGILITNGAFRISRHPIYTALIFSAFGFAIYMSSTYKILISIILLILFYYKSIYEEKLLITKFPEYKNYKKKTRRFI